jgi:hypothetical protein
LPPPTGSGWHATTPTPTAADTDVVTAIVALASGTLDEAALADWIRLNSRKRLAESR